MGCTLRRALTPPQPDSRPRRAGPAGTDMRGARTPQHRPDPTTQTCWRLGRWPCRLAATSAGPAHLVVGPSSQRRRQHIRSCRHGGARYVPFPYTPVEADMPAPTAFWDHEGTAGAASARRYRVSRLLPPPPRCRASWLETGLPPNSIRAWACCRRHPVPGGHAPGERGRERPQAGGGREKMWWRSHYCYPEVCPD
jgi:hypothetical protein